MGNKLHGDATDLEILFEQGSSIDRCNYRKFEMFLYNVLILGRQAEEDCPKRRNLI